MFNRIPRLLTVTILLSISVFFVFHVYNKKGQYEMEQNSIMNVNFFLRFEFCKEHFLFE